MSELHRMWSVASLSIDGVEAPSSLDDTNGLLGLSGVYVNNICDMLGIKQFFHGTLNEDGQFKGGLTDDAETSTLALFFRHLASQGEVLDGKLDMSGPCDVWLSSLPYLMEDGKLDVSSTNDSIVLQMISVQLNIDEFEPDPALLKMPSHYSDDSMRVSP